MGSSNRVLSTSWSKEQNNGNDDYDAFMYIFSYKKHFRIFLYNNPL